MARPSVFNENSFKFSDQKKNMRALYTPDFGGKVDKKNLTQVGRALGQRGTMHYPDGRLAPCYGPRCIGRYNANGQSYDKEEKTLGEKAA
jgi:hypothetical protein